MTTEDILVLEQTRAVFAIVQVIPGGNTGPYVTLSHPQVQETLTFWCGETAHRWHCHARIQNEGTGIEKEVSLKCLNFC